MLNIDSSLKDTADQVFTRLQRSGPLCPSQISVDLGISVSNVRQALKVLWAQGVAERSKDPSHPDDPESAAANSKDPWRIRFRGKKVRLQRTAEINSGAHNIEETLEPQ